MNYKDIKIISEEDYVKGLDKAQLHFYNSTTKRNKEYIRFCASLDPNMDWTEYSRLTQDFQNRRDEDAIEAMNHDRPDADERQTAFYESLLNAIQTDDRCSSRRGFDVFYALKHNSAEALLVALCGWGANDLAKRAGIIPDDGYSYDFYDDDDDYDDDDSIDEVQGKLIVNWSNGKQTSSKCVIEEEDLYAIDFDPAIFKTYADSAEIESVIVEVCPCYSDKCYHFNCISAEEKERTEDEFSYGYSLDDEDVDINPNDDNEK